MSKYLFIYISLSIIQTNSIDPSNPPHSKHSSNLYKRSNLVEELTIDPVQWKWQKNSPLWAVILYAPWCGHCQHFKPTWEEFATKIRGATCDTIKDQMKVRVGAVNCVAHEEICDSHGLTTYPTLLLMWKEDNVMQIHKEEMKQRTVAAMITEVQTKLGCTGEQDTHFIYSSDGVVGNLRGGTEMDSSDTSTMEGTMASSGTASVDGRNIHTKPLMRDRLEDAARAMKFSLLQLFAGRTTMNEKEHTAAKQWITALLQTSTVIFDASVSRGLKHVLDVWSQHPTDLDHSQYDALLRASNVLKESDDAESLSTMGWKTCRDASITNDNNVVSAASASSSLSSHLHKRGFTCGLWTLFHLMGSNGKDSKVVVRGVISFIHNFFQCEQCRTHFMQEYGTDTFVDKYEAELSQSGATEWLWRAHNGVNARLRKMEPKGSRWMLPYPSCRSCFNCCFKNSQTLNEQVALQYVKDMVYCVDRKESTLTCQGVQEGQEGETIPLLLASDMHVNVVRVYQTWWFLFGIIIIVGIGCWSKMKRMSQAMSNKTVKGKACTL